MKKYITPFIPFLLFLFITCIMFKPYFIDNKIPFPSNLLVSYYEPYISYPSKDYPSGPPNKPIGFDSLRIYYPFRKLTTEALQHFSLPLWNPYAFSGNTQLATYQSAVFHPLSFLFFILPQIEAWSISVILAPLLAMVFMFLFLREVGLTTKASTFGAVGFGLSGFMIVNTEELFLGLYSAILLPLILYGVHKSYKNYSPIAFLCITLGTAFSIFSGWFQMTFYGILFAFFYSVFLFVQQKDKKIFLFTLMGFILGILIAAIHLIPSFEAYMYSARGTTDAKFLFDSYLVPWYHLITYVAPDFFGNPGSYNYFGIGFYFEKMLYVALPILLFGIYAACISLRKEIRRNTSFIFFTVVWIITLILGFSSPISWFVLYSLHLPLIATMVPSRIFFLSTVCLSVLAAYGFESYLKRSSWRGLASGIVLVAIILGSGWVYVIFINHFVPKVQNGALLSPLIPNTLPMSKRNLLLPTVFFFLTSVTLLLGSNKFLRRYASYALLFIVIISSIYFTQKYFYFSERRFTFPNVPVLQKLVQISGNNRVWSFGPGYIERNFLSYYHLQSPEGYDSLSIQRYLQLLFAASNKGRYVPEDVARADAVILSGQNTSEIVQNKQRLRLLSLLGVKYVVGANTEKSDHAVDHTLLSPFWHDNKFIIYIYQGAQPRTFLVDKYYIASDNGANLNLLFSPRIDIAKTVILEKKIFLQQNKIKLSGNAKISLYSSNEVVISTDANKPTLLFLSDNDYPGWNAFIDGKKTEIYRADYSFRSVILPIGRHTVVFRYQPESFVIGLLVSILGITACILFLLRKKLLN